jgi:hypothetical protein
MEVETTACCAKTGDNPNPMKTKAGHTTCRLFE